MAPPSLTSRSAATEEDWQHPYAQYYADTLLTPLCNSRAITYPLVNLSTRSQVAAKHDNQTTKAAALKVIKEDGIAALYDGLTSSLLGVAVTNGIYYLFFEESRAWVIRNKKDSKSPLTMLESIAASAFAGAATSILSNPIWVVNTRQTVRTSLPSTTGLSSTSAKPPVTKKLNVMETILHIIRTDGPAAFFHGLGPALILVSNPILQFTLFEQLKNIIIARRTARNGVASALSDLDFFFLGAICKLFATGITYPYLTVKARMQAGQVEGRSYSSSLDGVRKIVQTDGLPGLYRGIGPKLTQSVATAAILFLAKEKIYRATVKALGTVVAVP